MSTYYLVSFANKTRTSNDRNSHNHVGSGINTVVTFVDSEIVRYNRPNNYDYMKYVATIPVLKLRNDTNIFGFKKKTVSEEYKPIPIICECNDDYVTDVITGKRYLTGASNSVISKDIVLALECSIDKNKVADILRGLTQEDIEKYKKGIEKLESSISRGYELDKEFKTNERGEENSVDSYIKSFRNR